MSQNELEVFFPRDEEELFETLSPETKIINGGTDLMVRKHLNRLDAKRLVSLDKMEGLRKISDEGDSFRVFARTTYSDILNHTACEEFPVLAKAIREIGSTQIRNRGTLTGNVVNASPAGDAVLALYLLEAMIVIHSKNEQKTIRIDNFIKGPGKTVLEPGQYVHSIIIPKAGKGSTHYFKKVGQRKAMAISIASMGAVYTLKKGMFLNLAIAFGSLGPTVIRAEKVEAKALGMPFNEQTLSTLAQIASNTVKPITDVRASAQYRKEVAGNLIISILS